MSEKKYKPLKRHQKFYLVIKRLIDIFGSFVGIVVCAVFIWWWCFIGVKCSSKGPFIFKQERIGKNGKVFKLYKIRSMKNDVDHYMASEDANFEMMTTKFGNFLRKSSLDETTQLFNIFSGKMSFIGPRPLIDKAADHKTLILRKENGSFALKPGISGYAQINGRTELNPERKAYFDGYYYLHFSFILDVKIFIKTIFKKNKFFGPSK